MKRANLDDVSKVFKKQKNEICKEMTLPTKPALPEDIEKAVKFAFNDKPQFHKLVTHLHQVLPTLEWWELFKDLSTDQYLALQQLVFSKDPVIIVRGVAGSGKSHLIKFYIEYAKACKDHNPDLLHNADRCAGNCNKFAEVLAPTGIAARGIDGMTIDMYLGGCLSVERSKFIDRLVSQTYDLKAAYETVVEKILRDDGLLSTYNSSLLIIDECFMVRGALNMVFVYLLEKIPCLKLRFFGDPYQLLPVLANRTWGKYFEYFIHQFQWPSIELSKIIRTDNYMLQKIILMLRAAIIQNLTLHHFDPFLKNLMHDISRMQGKIKFDKISTEKMIVAYTNAMNHRNNTIYLQNLPGKLWTYVIQTADNSNTGWYNRLVYENKVIKDLRIVPKLMLKVGATVMTTRNMPQYKNGMIGTVQELYEGIIKVKFGDTVCDITPLAYDLTDAKHTYRVQQFPVILAHSITVYKTQGITCKVPLYIMASRSIDMRCLYVLFSRIQHLNMLYFSNPLTPEFFSRCFLKKNSNKVLSLKDL